MACSTCKQRQLEQQNRAVVQRQRTIVVNNNNSTIVLQSIQSNNITNTEQDAKLNVNQEPASNNFQIPRILPPIKR